MRVARFGEADGVAVFEAVLTAADGSEARVISWGATLRHLRVPVGGRPRPVVLGLPSLDAYRAQSGHLGAIVGRYANRIAGARFRLDGQEIRLLANEGANMLHGGPVGFGRRPWTLEGRDRGSALFRLVSADRDMGFPGRLEATALYELRAPATLRITLEAVSDAPTPVNLTTHGYYNLDGSADVRDHLLTVPAGCYTQTGPDMIPTGAVLPVEGTRFDFRRPRPIRSGVAGESYDVNLVLDEPVPGAALRVGAILTSPAGDLTMRLLTSEPGLQLYDGSRLDVRVAGSADRLGPFAGVALEPQRFPDGPNQPGFPPTILRPGEVSRQVTELAFAP